MKEWCCCELRVLLPFLSTTRERFPKFSSLTGPSTPGRSCKALCLLNSSMRASWSEENFKMCGTPEESRQTNNVALHWYKLVLTAHVSRLTVSWEIIGRSRMKMLKTTWELYFEHFLPLAQSPEQPERILGSKVKKPKLMSAMLPAWWISGRNPEHLIWWVMSWPWGCEVFQIAKCKKGRTDAPQNTDQHFQNKFGYSLNATDLVKLTGLVDDRMLHPKSIHSFASKLSLFACSAKIQLGDRSLLLCRCSTSTCALHRH